MTMTQNYPYLENLLLKREKELLQTIEAATKELNEIKDARHKLNLKPCSDYSGHSGAPK